MAVKSNNPKMGRPVSNKHKVQKRRWDSWTNMAKRIFNRTFETLRNRQSIYMHPKAAAIPKEHWKTVAWNAAWTAADASMGIDSSRNRT